MPSNKKNRTVGLCGERILGHMRRKGWGNEKLASKAGISTGTVSLLLRDRQPATWKTAEKIRDALGLDSIDQIRPISSPETDSDGKINEWLLGEALTRWVTASNQLQFRIWRMQHQHISKFARGKCYDLVSMSSSAKESCKAHLTRHAEVCTRINSKRVIRNLTTFEEKSGDRWWVIDEWPDGDVLSDRLGQKSLSKQEATAVSTDILRAIASLHENEIVCRELSPERMIVRTDGSVLLTEFELAKLLDGNATVSNEHWEIDPYRAPEAESDDVDHRADIYSWARITAHLFLGTLPDVGEEVIEIKKAGLDKKLAEALCKSLSVSRRKRPSLDELIETIGALN